MAVILHDSETQEVMINQKPQKITRLRVCDDSDGGTCMRVTIWEPEFSAKRGEIIALRCARLTSFSEKSLLLNGL